MRRNWRSRRPVLPTSPCWSRTTTRRRTGRKRRHAGGDRPRAPTGARPAFRRRRARGGRSRARRRQAGHRLFHRLVDGVARRLSSVLPGRRLCRPRSSITPPARARNRSPFWRRKTITPLSPSARCSRRRRERDMRVVADRALQARRGRHRGRQYRGARRPDRRLFIPEQAAAMPEVAQALAANGLDSQQSADPRHGPVERFPRAEPAGLAGRLVRRAGKCRLRRLRPALSRQIRLRSDPRGDAGL